MLTFILFALLIVAFAVNIAPGMLLMDNRGRAFQAGASVVMLLVKILITIALVPEWGGAGAVAGTLLAVTICMVIPAFIAYLAQRRVSQRVLAP